MINASLQGELAEKIAAEIVAVAKKTDKPVFLALERARRAGKGRLRAAR